MKSTSKLVALLLVFCTLIGVAFSGLLPVTEKTKAIFSEEASKNENQNEETKVPTLPDQAINSSDLESGAEPVLPSVSTVGNFVGPKDEEASFSPYEEKLPSSQEKNESVSKQPVQVTPKGEYNKGIVLVKFEDKFSASSFGKLSYTSAEPLFEGSKWYTVTLSDENNTEEAVKYLADLGTFETVDYDYVLKTTTEIETIDVTGNPHYGKHHHHHAHKIPEGWQEFKKNGKHPGGSEDVIVAVIDTGVDYNHLDLRNNIWVNTAEIAGNGKDDDGNGYIDDIHGWDCVGDDKDAMDDNGHGTHVAGIVAAENNKIGGVGIAYSCKIMVLKAGNSSGYFNSSDIAEAIQYAYMNGASVINMSFAGTTLSIAVEEALQNAYNTTVLVAAAGNNALCNQPGCPKHTGAAPLYPAALPYVIGVMSTDGNVQGISSFSNFDHYPYNAYEYEVFAVGEAVPSTWPGNKYATLYGTSMAAPTVSGIAALLRSYYPDREMYSTKFIQSQIVNTGTICLDGAHTAANVYEAMTQIPKPAVNLYGYFIDDSTSIASQNNGNGVIDAGETVHLHISLHNRGGVAEDVEASIDTLRTEGVSDPYFNLINDTITLSDIGTYSVRESGDQYFVIKVDADCPNSYLVNFNIRFTYTNGMDVADNTLYEGKGTALCNVNRGYHLSGSITEDTVFESDRLYIVSSDVVIPEGVTVTFKEGCRIQFYDNRQYYNSPTITVYGTLNFEGTKDEMISLFPDELHKLFVCQIVNLGCVNISYTKALNLTIAKNVSSYVLTNAYLADSHFQTENIEYLYSYQNGKAGITATIELLGAESIKRCYLDFPQTMMNIQVSDLSNSVIVGAASRLEVNIYESATGNIFYSHSKTIGSAYTNSAGYVFGYSNTCATVNNNIFCTGDDNVGSLPKHTINSNSGAGVSYKNNAFSESYQKYASQVIRGYYDASGNPTVDVYGSLSDPSVLWPFVVSVEMFDKKGEPITTVGMEEIKVRVTFNRPMDQTAETFLTFGTREPYADYRIEGEYISDTVWEGTYTLKAQIENGQNFLKVNSAWAAEDPTKTVVGDHFLHEFTIDTTAAMAMNLQATAKEEGIELTFTQDDYTTLLGYNVYRSEEKDGNFVKLNPAVLLPEENTFLDENAEPGKTYWYTYTVVLSDFTESGPAGKVQAAALDTMAPSLYHTPVNQGYENNNLVISATAKDNVAIQSVTLYYRTVGATDWKTLSMVKQNDKYSATVFGSDVTLSGLEYYIVAQDAVNPVQKGSAEEPYTVVVKSADSLLGLGDVDGNGQVTTKDALMLMQCLNGDLILSDDQFKRADLNKDSILSSVEALRILQYVNGKITTLEM